VGSTRCPFTDRRLAHSDGEGENPEEDGSSIGLKHRGDGRLGTGNSCVAVRTFISGLIRNLPV
jgi:hypothetical protein